MSNASFCFYSNFSALRCLQLFVQFAHFFLLLCQLIELFESKEDYNALVISFFHM